MTLSRFPAPSVSLTMDSAQEPELVARLRAGDAEAFDQVHLAYNVRLFNFLCRLAGRREVAEDLLEETWLRVVTNRHRLRPDTRLGPWLFTVARNLHISYTRSRLLEDRYASELIGLWPAGVPAVSPLAAAEADETRRRLATALATLPVRYREALVLTAVQGLRPAEAAEVCGVTSDAMRQRLSRARALLARRLEDGDQAVVPAWREATT